MARPIVGITCSLRPAKDGAGAAFLLPRAYCNAVEAAGGVPVLLPAGAAPDAARVLDRLDALILSGGVDVAPARYGRQPHPALGDVDAERDELEIALARAALASGFPLLAICRGIQVLNVAAGGTLIQDLPAERPSSISHRQSDQSIPRSLPSHAIVVDPGSRLAELAGASRLDVNSFHHQALDDVAPCLIVTARAEDGVVEAVEAPGRRFTVGVQFHPEETAPNDATSRRLFEALVASA